MHIEVFRYRVNPDFQDEFETLYARMAGLIKGLSGYLGHKVYTADDGEKLLVGYFSDFATVEAWDRHPEHKHAKERGRSAVFAEYEVMVGEVVEHHSSKDT